MRSISDAELEDRFVSTFGVSSEEFERQLEVEFNQATPEEQAEFERVVNEANAVLPGMIGRVDRMSERRSDMRSSMIDMRSIMAFIDKRLSRMEDGLLKLPETRLTR